MPLTEEQIVSLVITVIQFVSTLIIVGYAGGAVLLLARGPHMAGQRRARRRVAEGVLLGLSLVVGATLLRTIIVLSFVELGLFAAIFALRTFLKRTFTWEAQHM